MSVPITSIYLNRNVISLRYKLIIFKEIIIEMSVKEKYNLPLPVRSTTKALSDRFIEGLEQYNLSIEEIKGGGWKYCGGDTGYKLNYLYLSYPHLDPPPHTDRCVCGHEIQENCYITNGKEVLVLGNVCVKRFLPPELSGRNCSECGCPHRNRKVNKCNNCR